MTVAEILNPDRLVEIVDIGANPIDGVPPYRDLHEQGLSRITGFEPQERAWRALQSKAGRRERYFPFAIGDGERHTLRQCRISGMSSLLKPDPMRLQLFNEFPKWGEVLAEETVATRRLDDVDEIGEIDLLKIDIQGSELAVFRAGQGKLASALCVITEVSFIPLYEDQPCFGEIDVFLRGLGFVPHSFLAIKRWPIAPTVFGGDRRRAGNQLLEADISYVRDFGSLDRLSESQLKLAALIASHVLKSADLMVRYLLELYRRGLLSLDQIRAVRAAGR